MQGVLLALSEGKSVQRVHNNNRKEIFFLKTDRKRQFLFKRTFRVLSGEPIESPAMFDWDDLKATNYEVV
jgi:hypothetical protein